MDVHPTKNVSIGIDPYPNGSSQSQVKLVIMSATLQAWWILGMAGPQLICSEAMDETGWLMVTNG
jgi:hypothetical protein